MTKPHTLICKRCKKTSYSDKRNKSYICVSCRQVQQDKKLKIRVCRYCKDNYLSQKTSRKYCSYKCAMLVRFTGKTISCGSCTKEMYIPKSSKQKYCSVKCTSNAALESKLVKLCVNCSKEMLLTASSKRIFCSTVCYRSYAVGERSGSYVNGNGYKGGFYPKAFSIELKASIRERDGHICKECNALDHLSIHHIDYDHDNNHPSNLITLCNVCNSRANGNKDYMIKRYRWMVMGTKDWQLPTEPANHSPIPKWKSRWERLVSKFRKET